MHRSRLWSSKGNVFSYFCDPGYLSDIGKGQLLKVLEHHFINNVVNTGGLEQSQVLKLEAQRDRADKIRDSLDSRY